MKYQVLGILASVALHAAVLAGVGVTYGYLPSLPHSATLCQFDLAMATATPGEPTAPALPAPAAVPPPATVAPAKPVPPLAVRPTPSPVIASAPPVRVPDPPKLVPVPAPVAAAASVPSADPVPATAVHTLAMASPPPTVGSGAGVGATVVAAPAPAAADAATATAGGDGSDATAYATADLLEVIRRTNPVYPMRARTRQIEGRVTLEFVVTPQGSASHITVQAAAPGDVFEDAAIAALQKWQFRPILKDGRPIAVRARQTFAFRLDD